MRKYKTKKEEDSLVPTRGHELISPRSSEMRFGDRERSSNRLKGGVPRVDYILAIKLLAIPSFFK